MESTAEMIDLHCHILMGLDDGPQMMEESIRMCRIACRDGIRTIVATPHMLNGVYQNAKSTILERVEELNAELRSESTGRTDHTRHPELDLRILPGSDIHLCEATLEKVDQNEAITIGDGGRYLLVELPSHAIPYQSEAILFQLLARGVTPVISHPERNLEIGTRPGRYYEMIKMGCLGQVTAMSLTGDFGSRVRKLSEKLLKAGLVHLIATDAHSSDGRPPILSAALKAASKIVGKEEAIKMVTDYPRAILEGQRLNLKDPIPI
jgi:protein-tyrosine phosphatase